MKGGIISSHFAWTLISLCIGALLPHTEYECCLFTASLEGFGPSQLTPFVIASLSRTPHPDPPAARTVTEELCCVMSDTEDLAHVLTGQDTHLRK